MRQFAISDIHGHVGKFSNLLDQLQLTKQDELYLLGDYVDRGSDSKGVIDLIWSLQADGYQLKCICGNHEEMLLDSLFDEEDELLWLRNKGATTLKSFGVDSVTGIPKKYLSFLRRLPYYFLTDQYCFVHAGLNFKEADPFSDTYEMIWIRNWYKDMKPELVNNRIIIHGHTPIKKPEIVAMVDRLEEDRVLNVDNGSFRTSEGMGSVCAVDLANKKAYFSK